MDYEIRNTYKPAHIDDKTPSWKSLKAGDRWLIINHTFHHNIEVGNIFIHTFSDKKTKAKMRLVHSSNKDHMCEFVEWIV